MAAEAPEAVVEELRGNITGSLCRKTGVALPELVEARIEMQLAASCERRVPWDVRHLVRLSFKVRGKLVTLFEDRGVHNQPDQWVSVPISQFRFDPERNEWTLYCCDQNGRWFVYKHADAARDVGSLFHAVELDVTRIFWG